jgi:hypothetical protein
VFLFLFLLLDDLISCFFLIRFHKPWEFWSDSSLLRQPLFSVDSNIGLIMSYLASFRLRISRLVRL